jgi:hypothetical protein
MFAYDLLLFDQANLGTINSIIITLTKFCSMLLGQKVNQAKTLIFFSKNVSRPTRNKLTVLNRLITFRWPKLSTA